MRCSYLAVDRPDISEAVKCLSQANANPRQGHMTKLKHLARYLLGAPRMAISYSRQSPSDSDLKVYVDSDHAGCVLTRRSTTGMVVMRGNHVLRHQSTLQIPIGLNSGESE